MKSLIVLISMIFLHCIADYHLQGILASMKQKNWWTDQTKDERYENDYIIALMAHSFEWSFIVLLPLMIEIVRDISYWPRILVYVMLLLANTLFHMTIDDCKANARNLNLVGDQIFHLGQIAVSWFAVLVCIGW